jgi:sigma-B regulation protein RsbU (phosphoserine phosphatase)
MIGAGAAGYLYLDNKGATGGGSAPDADEFIVGLARLAALSLSNLKRLDLERRHARIEAEIAAAAEAQQWILPPRQGVIGPLTYRGESKPGRDLCGDFFDVISLDEPRTAVALGDVSGKGAAAGVLMTASQGFLHAALRLHGDPARAVADLSTFLRGRMPENKFLTLWLGVFDTSKCELAYVDAGHSHAAMIRADATVERLNRGDGTLVGIFDNARYTVVKTKFDRGDRALIVSDGLVEQPTATQDDEGRHEQFGIERVIECLRSAAGDAVNSLFQAVEAHAGGPRLNDDATAVLLRW